MTNQEQIFQRYLLGEMSEAERSALELKYFDDPRLFNELVEAENGLVDSYARGALPQPTRDRFEKYYLAHAARRERLKFGEALISKVDRTSEVSTITTDERDSLKRRWFNVLRGPGLAWAFSVAVLVMAAVATWFLFETRRLKRQFANIDAGRTTQEQRERELLAQVDTERQRAQQLAAELERLRAQTTSGTPSPTPTPTPTPAEQPAPLYASLVLTVGGTRGAETTAPAVLTIIEGTKQVRLQLSVRESDYTSYRALLQSPDGQQVFSWGRLVPRTSKVGASIVLTLPAERFETGDYILTLRGASESGEIEDVSKSLFRVERQARPPAP